MPAFTPRDLLPPQFLRRAPYGVWVTTALASLALTTACDKKIADSTVAPPPPDSAFEEPPWRETLQRDLSDEQLAALHRAESARTVLGARLIGLLSETIDTQGVAAAVPVCRQLAPSIAADAGRQFHVAVGRTAARLRNPNNLAPVWASSYIEANHSEPVILTGPDGRVATLHPIRTGELCTRCHGPADALAPDVLAAIQSAYPLDTATGFKEGDIRGWFWTEAPLVESPPSPNELPPLTGTTLPLNVVAAPLGEPEATPADADEAGTTVP